MDNGVHVDEHGTKGRRRIGPPEVYKQPLSGQWPLTLGSDGKPQPSNGERGLKCR